MPPSARRELHVARLTSVAIFDAKGVKVTAFSVPHGIDGAVGYRLDWNGLSMVFAGDCEPSQLTVDNSQDLDVLIHETFNPLRRM